MNCINKIWKYTVGTAIHRKRICRNRTSPYFSLSMTATERYLRLMKRETGDFTAYITVAAYCFYLGISSEHLVGCDTSTKKYDNINNYSWITVESGYFCLANRHYICLSLPVQVNHHRFATFRRVSVPCNGLFVQYFHIIAASQCPIIRFQFLSVKFAIFTELAVLLRFD